MLKIGKITAILPLIPNLVNVKFYPKNEKKLNFMAINFRGFCTFEERYLFNAKISCPIAHL